MKIDDWLYDRQDWFAWRPVRLVNGRWAWWCWLERSSTQSFGRGMFGYKFVEYRKSKP